MVGWGPGIGCHNPHRVKRASTEGCQQRHRGMKTTKRKAQCGVLNPDGRRGKKARKCSKDNGICQKDTKANLKGPQLRQIEHQSKSCK